MSPGARRIAVWLLAVASTAQSPGAAPPELTLPGIAAARFASGAVIRLPRHLTVPALEAKFPGTPPTPRIDLHTDTRLPANGYVEHGSLVLSAQTKEPRGLFQHDEQTLRALRVGQRSPVAEWRLVRWANDNAFIDASISVGGGTPDLQIQQPRGGVFVFTKASPASVTVAGTVFALDEVDVRVADAVVETTAGDGGNRTFQATVPWSSDRDGVEVLVRNRVTGSTRQHILRAITAR